MSARLKCWLIAILAFALLVSAVPANKVRAQDSIVKVTSDFELLGLQELHGGGHLTYFVDGDAAADLRRRVREAFDGAVSPFQPDNTLSAAELDLYAQEVEHFLEQGVKFFAGTTIGFRPLHRTGGEPITVDFDGFVGVDVNSTTVPINIFLYFDARATADQAKPLLVPQEYFRALYDPFQGRINNSGPWQGQYTFDHMDYRVGLVSYWNTQTSGTVYVFRTPAGEVVSYGAKFTYGSSGWTIPQDRAEYQGFNFLENPQVLFILVFVCGYVISSVPNRQYAAYKLAHPRRVRHKAKRITWIHITGIVLILLLLIFYFVPNFTMLFGLSWFMSGVFLWILGPVFAIIVGVSAKVMYDKATKAIPPAEAMPIIRRATPLPQSESGVRVVVSPSPGPMAAPAPMAQAAAAPAGPPCGMCKQPLADAPNATKCTCGRLFHPNCVLGMKTCPYCQAFLPGAGPKTVKVQCPTCGEINDVPEDADKLSVKCKACKVPLEAIESGYNYLVVTEERRNAYEAMMGLVKSKKMIGLAITTTFPDKVKKEYDLGNTEVVWMSDTSGDPKILNPKRLEFETMRTIGNFIKGRKDSVLMIDGFEYLVVENGFDKVLKFFKKINDLCSVNQSTFLVPMSPGAVTPDQLAILKKEFDQVIEF
ncbi:MAG: DUF835 domain-containing protein [Euryarchaeota archaeon]|nr:DUF835 domain-containing protein [Euryarchaeota archaeon]